MSEAPTWALSLIYWLHMLATVAWIGGLAGLLLLVWPTIQRNTPPEIHIAALAGIQRRFDPVTWFALVLLLGTGMVQMSVSSQYEGFLAFSNLWAWSLLLKHVVYLGMIGVNLYLTWGIGPGTQRGLLLQAKGKDAPDLGRLHKLNLRLLWVNLALGGVVLAFTAVARAVA